MGLQGPQRLIPCTSFAISATWHQEQRSGKLQAELWHGYTSSIILFSNLAGAMQAAGSVDRRPPAWCAQPNTGLLPHPHPESRVCSGKPVRCPYIQGAQEMGAPSFVLQRACRAAFPPACFHSLSGPPVSRGRLSDFLSGCGFQGTRPCWVYRCPECACSQQLPVSAPCPLPVPHSLQCSLPLLTVRPPGEEGPLSPDPGC